jgi:predicted secreted hydrolase
VTFFRSRPGFDESNPSRFAAKQLLFAHVAISDPRRGQLLRDEKVARAGFGLAEASDESLNVFIDDWSLQQDAGSPEVYRTKIVADGFSLELEFKRTQPMLLQGQQGFSQKGPRPESSSYYYSLPQLQTAGRVRIDGRASNVHGVAWLDHEWSSSIMDDQAQGWDWAGINLDDGGAVMMFRMRDADGGEHWAAATLREGVGEVNGGPRTADSETAQRSNLLPARQTALTTVFSAEQIDWQPLRRWRSLRTRIEYPIEWKVRVGERTLILKPLLDDQENDARSSTGTLYWEGAVRAFDERNQPIGRGYLELTGYGGKVRF